VPRRIRRTVGQLVERPGVVRLEAIADEQEGQQEAQAAPHPRVEALDGDVHVVPLPEGLQSVEQALLVAELQILHDACNRKGGISTNYSL